MTSICALRLATSVTIPCGCGKAYLFTENGVHQYVGRTGQHLFKRVPEHWTVKDAPLAFRIARHATGKFKASYKADEDSRKKWMKLPVFARAFTEAKSRIGKMDIRYVRVGDPTTQALLEIYTAIKPHITNSPPPRI